MENQSTLIAVLLVGFFGGILSGAVGIGGGTLLVPMLVLILGFTQKQAQGTTLAMLLFPVVALSVWTYHKAGHVDWRTAIILAVTFFVGGYLGAKMAVAIPDTIKIQDFIIRQPLKKIFAVFLIIVAVRMFMK